MPEADQSQTTCLPIIPAGVEGVQCCVVVNIDNLQMATLSAIVRTAVQNGAFIDNSDEEAGDDLYAVQFPGYPQALLDRDAIVARLRDLLEGGWDD